MKETLHNYMSIHVCVTKDSRGSHKKIREKGSRSQKWPYETASFSEMDEQTRQTVRKEGCQESDRNTEGRAGSGREHLCSTCDKTLLLRSHDSHLTL